MSLEIVEQVEKLLNQFAESDSGERQNAYREIQRLCTELSVRSGANGSAKTRELVKRFLSDVEQLTKRIAKDDFTRRLGEARIELSEMEKHVTQLDKYRE